MTAIAPYQVTATRASIAGAIASAAGVTLIGQSSACDAISAAILGGIITAVVAFTLRFYTSPRTALLCSAGMALVLALAFGIYTRTSLRHDAFMTAFGQPPSPAIRNLSVSRYYAGGPGDTLTFMRFEADPAVIEQLLASLPPSEDTWALDLYLKGETAWPRFWQSIFFNAESRRSDWQAPSMPFADPRLHIRTQTTPAMSQTTVFYDRSTGQVFVKSSFG